ncbi:flagellar motor switch protein FliG [Opitutales bacterium ASA1]|jgi:flagellar motor switch protein FliG|uniref:flagellar motor switch protein FliG n=1 Tax=Congregicoccus parvus TaxID=3081749 RepID=UPI002B31738B|nr:flagellar motor switch protein FliG [Opitutales bacterium ASA1]
MPAIVYDNLTKLQKLAIFLIVLGPEVAAEILRQFEDAEIEAICKEMTNFQFIDPQTQREAMEEFIDVIGSNAAALTGGASFARRALELAKGDTKAASILEKIAPGSHSADGLKEIEEMEPRHIYNRLKNEQAQTVAFILSYVEPPKAAAVVALFPQHARDEVLARLSTLNSTSIELVSKVARSMTCNVQSAKVAMHASGGVRAAADILNTLERDTSKDILTRIEQRDPELGAQIRKKMFGFADLVRLEQKDLQRIMREIDTNDLVLALKTATPLLRDAISGALSKRAAETLKEELEMLGSVRLKDVEAAQDRIIQVVRRLEEQEEISLEKGGGGVVA